MNRSLFYLIVINFCLLGLLAGFLTGYFVSFRPVQGHVDVSQWPADALDRARRCTVSVSAANVPVGSARADSAGSGVVIDPEGYILTNEHIIHDAGDITVTLYNQQAYAARLVGASVRDDLAVLKIDCGKPLEAIEIGQVTHLDAGVPVAALGNPLDTASDGRCVTTFGLITRLDQRLSSSIDPLNTRFYDNMIQTDAKTLPGNSGGPLIDTAGRMIGLNTALGIGAETGRQFGFAIRMDSETLDRIDRLKSGQPIRHAFLGIHPVGLSPAVGQALGLSELSGALVASVLPDTPAWDAGILSGDVIHKIDGQTIHSPEELLSVLHRYQPEQAIKIELLRKINRDIRKISVDVKLMCRQVLLTSGRKINN